ncbi:dihydrofolate reductase [Quatrionicoccus australiensis]|uniref:dihydrofolate reductase n=1 Tax=Quatrionicoccus australiensis TaxID=138118 RepID=UPI001CFAC27B|nr:dihydrofolate reductase [Quatrionicoccus australiensis]MCB4359448.1 dihydrofolate reductase [Quatrionicoccus australiensis]
MPDIIIIAAVASNRVIGRDNQLLWNIPEDMAHFKTLTAGQTVVMGRKTWESLPPRFRPLPGRRNIVITRQGDYVAPGAEIAGSLEMALQLASTAGAGNQPASHNIFVIGGGEIYQQAMALATRLELTEVDDAPEGDTRFPEISSSAWQEERRSPLNSSSGLQGHFVSYRRRT